MGARKDRRGRLALQLLERDQRIGPAAQARCTLLDECAHERAILVECRAARMLVLDEGDRQLCSVVELTEQERERPEGEAAESELELRSANGHASGYGVAGPNPVAQPDLPLSAPATGVAGRRGTSRPCDCRRPARGTRSASRSGRTAGRRGGRRRGPGARPSPRRASPCAPSATRARNSSSLASRSGSHGETRTAQSVSDIHMFPMPATRR